MREPASVAVFQQEAREVIAELRARGATPVLVGGSALYTRAVLDRFDFPGTDDEVRGRWETELDRVGAPALHAVLAARDPEAAAGILPENGRRVVRALEVVELTGRPFSASLPALEYVDAAHRPDRRGHRPGGAGPADRGTGRRDVRRRLRRRGPSGCWTPGWPRAGPRPAPSATARWRRTSHGEIERGRGARGHQGGDPAVRPAPGRLVPQGPARGVGAVRRPGTARPGRGRRSREAEQERSGATPGPRVRLVGMSEQYAGRDRLRELLDAVLDEENQSLADMAQGAHSSPFHFSRQLSRTAYEPPVAMRRRVMLERAAVAAAARVVGHRRGVRGRLRVGRGVQPGVPARLRARRRAGCPSRGGHWLPAPNGIHFHPPTSLWVHAKEESMSALTEQLVAHDLDDTRMLLDLAKGLPDEDYRRAQLPGNATLSWDGPEESLADVLTKLVFTKEVWLAAIEGTDFPPERADDPATPGRAARRGRAAVARRGPRLRPARVPGTTG